MKLEDAIAQAKFTAKNTGLAISVVNEGPHADDHTEYDEDGNSYGYCQKAHVKHLYKYGKVVGTFFRVKP